MQATTPILHLLIQWVPTDPDDSDLLHFAFQDFQLAVFDALSHHTKVGYQLKRGSSSVSTNFSDAEDSISSPEKQTRRAADNDGSEPGSTSPSKQRALLATAAAKFAFAGSGNSKSPAAKKLRDAAKMMMFTSGNDSGQAPAAARASAGRGWNIV